jgi:hypothetical protein
VGAPARAELVARDCVFRCSKPRAVDMIFLQGDLNGVNPDAPNEQLQFCGQEAIEGFTIVGCTARIHRVYGTWNNYFVNNGFKRASGTALAFDYVAGNALFARQGVSASNRAAYWNTAVCHEIGHSLGLEHVEDLGPTYGGTDRNGCMTNDWFGTAPTSGAWQFFNERQHNEMSYLEGSYEATVTRPPMGTTEY